MRAKQINEIQNFERGQNPKKSMKLGGIDLDEHLEKRIESLSNEKDELIQKHNEDWDAFLKKTFVGKTITAELQLLPTIDKDGNVKGKTETRIFNIMVQDILVNNSFSSSSGTISTSIVLADMENNLYALRNLNQRIYFK